jgi:hypothetical protein
MFKGVLHGEFGFYHTHIVGFIYSSFFSILHLSHLSVLATDIESPPLSSS